MSNTADNPRKTTGGAIGIEEKLKESERERKRLENVLAHVEQKLNIIVQSVSDIIYTLDSNGLITFINEGVQHFGFQSSELIGMNIFEIVHPKDRNRAEYHVNERRTGERSTRSYELRFITKNQHNIDSETTEESYDNSPLLTITAEGQYRIEDGNSARFVGTIGIARPQSSETETTIAIENNTFIPVCANCRSIRNEHDRWERFESYFSRNHGLKFTHSICPACAKKIYSDIGLNHKD